MKYEKLGTTDISVSKICYCRMIISLKGTVPKDRTLLYCIVKPPLNTQFVLNY